jgi:hypothetical protein
MGGPDVKPPPGQDSYGPDRRSRPCRTCGGELSIFHSCPRLALADAEEDLGQAVLEAGEVEDPWAEVRARFPLTASTIIAAAEAAEAAAVEAARYSEQST